jgi:hypothetical protein
LARRVDRDELAQGGTSAGVAGGIAVNVGIATGDRGSQRVLAWAAAGALLYVLLGMASIIIVAMFEELIAAPIGLAAEAGTQGWGVVLGAHPIVWGTLTALTAAWLGRRLVPGVTFGLGGAALLGLGLLLAAVTTYLLHEFVRERYGWFDPEYAGFALFAAPAVVAVALAAWAALATPGRGWRVLVAAQLAAIAALGLAIGPSVPGLGDGIRASSLPLAACLMIDSVYALGTLAVVPLTRIRSAT